MNRQIDRVKEFLYSKRLIGTYCTNEACTQGYVIEIEKDTIKITSDDEVKYISSFAEFRYFYNKNIGSLDYSQLS